MGIQFSLIKSPWDTCLVDEGLAVDVVFPGFSQAFDTVPHSIHVDKLSSCGMRLVGHWAELKGRVQRVVGMGLNLSSDQSPVTFVMFWF